MGELAGLYVVLMLLAIVVAVLWILLPFAVFGIKPMLREIVQLQREQREALRAMAPQDRRE